MRFWALFCEIRNTEVTIVPEIVIALDAMGGDNAPGAAVEGAIAALEEWKDARILLFGQKGIAQPRERLELVETTEVITNDEAPMLAVRKKPGSSMVSAILSVKEGRAQAMVSAGSTGALLASGMVRLGRIKGVERPALATVIPSRKRPFLLIDSGANVDCLPKYLVQFGMMGSVYMHRILGVDEPRVGLVNIGAEAEKGNQLTKETFKLMQAQAQFRFEGNVEARDIPSGDSDVVVADGFAGNLILKYTEGLAQALVGMLKDEIQSSRKSMLGAAMMKDAFQSFKARMDYEEQGGAPLLGVNGAVVKAHGSSTARAFKNAIGQAYRMVKTGMVAEIEKGIAEIAQAEKKEENA